MTKQASLSVDWPQGLTAACERLLHPSVTGAQERERQRRLLQVLLAGPVLAALATAQVLSQQLGAGGALASVSMMFGVGLLMPFALIATARRRIVEPASLVLAAMITAFLIAAGGGLASPLTAMAGALVIETGWIGRTRRAFGFGLVAGCAAIALSMGVGTLVFMGADVVPSPFQWIVPLIYAGTVIARLPLRQGRKEEAAGERPGLAFEEIIDAAILRMHVSGDVTHASARSENLLGVAPEMLLGTGLFDRIHVADRIGYLTALSDLREGAEACTLRLRIRVPAEPGMPVAGAYRSFICDMAAERDAEGFAAMLRDDAPTAELEEALARARQLADGAIVARDQLLASVSHELRTPLNAIIGFSDVLGNEMFGSFANEKQREYVGLIRQSGEHLLSIVNALLDLSKLQSGAYSLQPEPFRFDEAVRLCLAMTTHQARAKCVDLATDIAEDVGTVYCDRRAVQQVLVNLLSNAVKFTPSGEVRVTAQRSGDRLEFTVSDTGIGISADDLQRVGQPFTQVQNDYTRQYDGLGLGLALVKGLVRLQGGGMSIESAPEAGTRVHISLPAGGADRRGAPDEKGATESGANWNGEWNDDALRKTA